MKQKEVKEVHEKASGNQLLRALKLDGKFLRHGEDDGEPDLLYSLDGKTVGESITDFLWKGLLRLYRKCFGTDGLWHGTCWTWHLL